MRPDNGIGRRFRRLPPPVPWIGGDSKAGRSWYILWHELLRRTFGEEVKCPNRGGRLPLIALVKKEEARRGKARKNRERSREWRGKNGGMERKGSAIDAKSLILRLVPSLRA